MRLYDFGRRKLLRKCENRRFPCMIVSILAQVSLSRALSLLTCTHVCMFFCLSLSSLFSLSPNPPHTFSFLSLFLLSPPFTQTATTSRPHTNKHKHTQAHTNTHKHTRTTPAYIQGERIFVGDVAESFFYAKYNRSTNSLSIFGDDTNARWLTAAWCC